MEIVQAFIPRWNSPTCHAEQLRLALHPHVDRVEVLEAYDVPFAEQWAEARSKFTGDIFLWVMADVSLPSNVITFVMRMTNVLCSRIGVAAWAPNIEHSAVVYNRKRLKELVTDVYDVPGTDLVCVALRAGLLGLLPEPSPHGWCFDYLIAGAARSVFGEHAVRDYSVTVKHPLGKKAYDECKALKETGEWLGGLPPHAKSSTLHCRAEQRELSQP